MELFQYLVDKEKYFGMNIQCYFSRVAIILRFVSFVSIRPTVSIRPVLRYLEDKKCYERSSSQVIGEERLKLLKEI